MSAEVEFHRALKDFEQCVKEFTEGPCLVNLKNHLMALTDTY